MTKEEIKDAIATALQADYELGPKVQASRLWTFIDAALDNAFARGKTEGLDIAISILAGNRKV